MAARAAASRLASAFAASRAARTSGKLLAAGVGSYGLYKAGEAALTETVPYAAGDGGGGRRRFAPPAWLASMLPEDMQPVDHAALNKLPPLAPGEIRIHGLHKVAPLWQRQVLEQSAKAVLAALQQEARSRPDGFGRHILDAGVYVALQGDVASASHPNLVCLPASIVEDYLSAAKGDMQAAIAALQFTLAHEMAHLYLHHLPEDSWRAADYSILEAYAAQACKVIGGMVQEALFGMDPSPATASAYQDAASKAKRLSWQQEFEADEVACAVLARLRLPPEQWVTRLKAVHAGQLAKAGSWIEIIEKAANAGRPDGEKEAAFVAAVAARMGWPSVGEGLAQLKAARAKGDARQLDQQRDRWMAYMRWQLLVDAADAEDRWEITYTVGKTRVFSEAVLGDAPCPEPAVLAMLMDLADTHPPTDVRVARIEHLATQLPMLQRATAPPLEVDGRFEAGSMAQAIADRAEAQRRAEAAKQGMRDAQQSAQKQSRESAQQAARQRAATALKGASQPST